MPFRCAIDGAIHKALTVFTPKENPMNRRLRDLCYDCKQPVAESGALFCPDCLKRAVRNKPPDYRDLYRRGTEMIGRPALPTAPLGGAPF
jgi:hypothetical protein